ncbi:hypothetical protein ABZ468_08185 [Streptomyces sp. NPDC005708]|uniref:hypothetical protein n=1 Tax=Streptomyces sp. NPDC005708 TaxID=3154564 RepID=UPI0033DAA9A5
MNTIMHFLDEHASKLVDILVALGGVYFGWWLGDTSRSRADRAAEKAALRVQADALIVAVLDVRGAAQTGHVLWDRPIEHLRTVALAGAAGVSELHRSRGTGESEWHGILAVVGAAVRVIAQDRIASKQYAATVREPMVRLTAAAAPLLRHPNPQVSTAAGELVNAACEIKKDTRRLDAAFAAFHAAVSAAEHNPPSWWRRLRLGRTASSSAQDS